MPLRRLTRKLGPVAFLFAAWPSLALACRNDTSSSRGEQEFRSRYETPPPTAKADRMDNAWGVLGASLGGGAVVGCLVVGVLRPRRGGV